MDLATGRRNRVPVAQLIRRTLREIEPHARELGSERELEGIREILARGNGADRQLRIYNANRDLAEVVSEIADVTEQTGGAGRCVIEVGERVPDASVWLGPRERVEPPDVWPDGRLTLLLFYLFDWSST